MLEIKKIPVSEMIPYINNPRTHSGKQISQIAASIKEFGFTNPILTDGKNGVIAGHGRLLAAKELGIDVVPVIELSHLSDIQKIAYVLADNKISENSGWDQDKISEELGCLSADGFDIFVTGFDLAKEMNKTKKTLDDKYTDENCEMAIVPDFFEKHQCFIIVTHDEIDENFVREALNLTENHTSNSGDKKKRKTNVIDVESLRQIWAEK